ncbi:metaxin-2-like [Branchiostoma floridae]|uniref:Metaxin-2-like n=1 Tax=Branchiostoma floridae TaxID=7739 RepID=A0A9J7N253_BRAFL|nr:metaxin-2-like [Branchiostoma floridae]XP_035686986.1 metaxin-2-like [Branchiostoma floridae]XP_035686988.1 metaxin-2-like [Branchiostoma floridae]XP_035686989.1 metaxin-2-like [Branchiostoma floridae]
MPAFVSEAAVSHNAPYIDPQWPRGVLLYQPLPDSQMTLNDNANCLAVKTLLHMNDLDFEVAPRTNAEDMSPTGKVPFLRAEEHLVAEWEPIMAFVNAKKYNLGSHLELWQKAEMKAYMSMVENVLKPAELWSSWCDEETAYQVTKPRYGSPYPWPLNSLLARRKQRAVWTIMTALGWRDKTAQQVYDEVNRCCLALSNRLGSSNYFFGHHQPNKAINGTKTPLKRQQAEDKAQEPESESQQKAPSDGNKIKSKLGGRRRWPKIYVDKQKSVEEIEFVEKTYEEDVDGIVTESVSTSIIEQRQDKKETTGGTADSLRAARNRTGSSAGGIQRELWRKGTTPQRRTRPVSAGKTRSTLPSRRRKS